MSEAGDAEPRYGAEAGRRNEIDLAAKAATPRSPKKASGSSPSTL
jgi:hypothetical protein